MSSKKALGVQKEPLPTVAPATMGWAPRSCPLGGVGSGAGLGTDVLQAGGQLWKADQATPEP